MNREEVQKLLGGYATGTLSPEEQQALFAAALDDQDLFDALAHEQSLRDLLRDPAAKAEVLSALDAALNAPAVTARLPWYRLGWWQPAAAAAAIAGIAVMVILVPPKPARPPATATATVAEMRVPATLQAPKRPAAQHQEPEAPSARRATVPSPGSSRPAAASPLAREASGLAVADEKVADEKKSDKKDVAVESAAALPAAPPSAAAPPAPAPPAAAPQAQLSAPSTENVAVQAQPVQVQAATAGQHAEQGQTTAQTTGQPSRDQAQQGQVQMSAQLGQNGFRGTMAASSGALKSRLLEPNARLLFYSNAVAADAAGKQKAGKEALVSESMRMGKAKAELAKTSAAPVPHLGVRCSIVRQLAGVETEVGFETALAAGEPVKLKVVPNDRGSLRIWERGADGAARTLATGTVQPLQPFEVTLPDYPSAGTRQLYVQFTRASQGGRGGAAGFLLPAQTPGNLIQTVADEPEKATYFVNRANDPAAQQLLVPVTITYK